jgi:hypothetical protein
VVNITGYSNIGIVGNVNFTLVCMGKHNEGLFVAVVYNLVLVNVTFSECGALFDSASANASSPFPAMAKFRVAMYIINVTNMVVKSTQFMSSSGMGLAVYNTDGNISISDCDFIENSIPEEELNTTSGGGGMLLHYSYCSPGLTLCDPTTNKYNSNSNITIDNCRFKGNQASSSDDITFHREKGNYTAALGKGGGIAVIFSGNSSENTEESTLLQQLSPVWWCSGNSAKRQC